MFQKRGSMHHFFVEPGAVGEDEIIITGSDVNHIKNVLRMTIDEKLLISDGQGNDYCCIISGMSDSEIVAEILEENVERTELSSEFYLFQGLPKSDKMELIVQKAVELGVKEIIPFKAKRCVVKLDDKKADSKIKRWQSISESAAKQSKRGVIPRVNEVMSFKEAVEYAKTFDISIIPYENFKDMSSTRKIIDKIEKNMKIGIFIGPEGGFDSEEVDYAIDNGIEPVSLGKRILRTETAGLAILSVLMFKLED